MVLMLMLAILIKVLPVKRSVKTHVFQLNTTGLGVPEKWMQSCRNIEAEGEGGQWTCDQMQGGTTCRSSAGDWGAALRRKASQLRHHELRTCQPLQASPASPSESVLQCTVVTQIPQAWAHTQWLCRVPRQSCHH